MENGYYKHLTRLLRFGQILGFPLPEQFRNAHKPRIFRYAGMGYSIFMTAFSFIQLLLTIGNTANISEEATLLGSGLRIIFNSSMFTLYLYLLINRKSLDNLLNIWKRTTWHMKDECVKFSSIWISILLLFVSALLETALYDWAVYTRSSDGQYINATFLEKYLDVSIYETENVHSIKKEWNPVLLGIFYVLSKFLTLGTDYSDSLCIVLSFGMSARLKSMKVYLKHRLYYQEHSSKSLMIRSNSNAIAGDETDTEMYWPHLYTDFVNLRHLSQKTSEFLSPLIFVCLMGNVFGVVTFLDNGLNLSGRSHRFQSDNASNYVSLWHYLIRTILVIHFASGVIRSSDETLSVIEDAPNAVKSWPDTEPILAMLKRKPIGINFFDTFFISNCIYLSILNFVFTIEIIILQASSSGRRK